MRHKNEKIKRFIIENIPAHPRDISLFAAQKLKINRRTVIDYLQELVKSGEISLSGKTRAREYFLGINLTKMWEIPIDQKTEENEIWRTRMLPELSGVADNVRRICQHGFTEMLNNVIDHSEADHVQLQLIRKQGLIWMRIHDNGIGIFERLRRAFGLSPEEALLELRKGKLTSSPDKHSGEGIFFTSKMFDTFYIQSRGYGFMDGSKLDAKLETKLAEDPWEKGTEVDLLITENSQRKVEEVFNEFTGTGDFGFVRTRIPLSEAKGKDEDLLSRSQARRVMARTELFKEVDLDFTGIERIGQAFADEIFRVFKNEHPEVKVSVLNAGAEIAKMISWVEKGGGASV